MEKIKLFVSYAHSNEDWISKDGKFKLIPWLERQLHGRVDIWTDHALKQQIGEEYTKLIREKIMQADMAILLISQDFVSSQYITDVELPLIRQCYMIGTMKIVPLLITSLTQKGKDKISWIFDLQTYPNDTKPLINFFNHDAEWEKIKVEILEGIENKIDTIVQKPKTVVSQPIVNEIPKVEFVQQTTKVEHFEEKPKEVPSKLKSTETKPSEAPKPLKKNNIVLYIIIAIVLIVVGVGAIMFMGKSSKQEEATSTVDSAIKPAIKETVEKPSTTAEQQTNTVKNNETTKSVSNPTNKTITEKPAITNNSSQPASNSSKPEIKTTEATPAKPAISTPPADPETFISEGNAFDDKGEFDNAIASYKKALTVDPKNAKAYNCLGITYFNKQDYDNSISAYMKCISIDPNNAKAYNNLGNVYGKKNDLAKQIVCYKNAAKLGHKKAQDWLKAHNETWQ